MTIKIGPRDVDVGWMERIAGRSTNCLVRAISKLANGELRFRPETATLSINGQSEHSGDPYERGLLVPVMLFANAVVPVGVLILLSHLPAVGENTVLGWGLFVVGLVLATFATANVIGSIQLIGKTDVVDHTTAPAPDAIDELREAYVAGEIDEQELEKRSAEVWADG